MKSAISVGSYVPSSQPDRRLATLSEELGKVGVNIEGFCATVAGGKGVLHVLVHDAALAGTALRGAGYTPVPSAFRAPVQTWCPPVRSTFVSNWSPSAGTHDTRVGGLRHRSTGPRRSSRHHTVKPA